MAWATNVTFFTASSVRARARNSAKQLGISVPDALLKEARRDETRYDVFLSQTVRDHDLVYGVYIILTEDLQLTVFCDWIDSESMDHSNVTPRHARAVRNAMSKSTGFVFLDTQNSTQSTWMSWELGWFDGANGRIAVFPILNETSEQYRGREFIGLYPVVEQDPKHTLMVRVPQEILMERATPGTVMGLATSMPFAAWLNVESTFFLGK